MTNAFQGFKTGIMVLAIAAVSAGCQNGVTHSVCANATGSVEGLTGVYEFTTQSDDFILKTQTIKIMPSDDKKNVASIIWNDGTEEDESHICNVNGRYIHETFSEKSKTYGLNRMYITNLGIHFVPLMFDVKALETAGIPHSVIKLPSILTTLLGSSLVSSLDTGLMSVVSTAAEEDSRYLVIDNRYAPAEVVLNTTKPSPIGVQLFRK